MFLKISEVVWDLSLQLENEVLLRFNYNEGMKYLRIAKAGKDKKLRTLVTLELPELNNR